SQGGHRPCRWDTQSAPYNVAFTGGAASEPAGTLLTNSAMTYHARAQLDRRPVQCVVGLPQEIPSEADHAGLAFAKGDPASEAGSITLLHSASGASRRRQTA